MHSPKKLQKIGALIIVIGGGIPGAMAIFMGATEREDLLGIHLTTYVIAMGCVFLVGAALVAAGLFKK